MDDLKKDVEKYKNEKNNLNEKVKKLQAQLESIQGENEEAGNAKVETKAKDLDEQEKLEILNNLKSTFETLQKKLVIYKETLEDLTKKDLKIQDLEKKFFQLRKERDSRFEEALSVEKIKFEE